MSYSFYKSPNLFIHLFFFKTVSESFNDIDDVGNLLFSGGHEVGNKNQNSKEFRQTHKNQNVKKSKKNSKSKYDWKRIGGIFQASEKILNQLKH